MSKELSPATGCLHIVSYSSSGPTHGGKIRSREISKLIDSVTSNVSIVYGGDCQSMGLSLPEWLLDLPRSLVGDLHLLYTDFRLAETITEVPSVIVFEQPWLWEEVKKLREKFPKVKLIYSSHNIEWILKENILTRYKGARVEEISQNLRDLETDISVSVDYVVAVSEIEADWYRAAGAPEVLVAPNGASAIQIPTPLEARKISTRPYGLVVGSAHPPNIEGCLVYLSNPDLWLIENHNLVVIGTLASALKSDWSGNHPTEQSGGVIFIDHADDSELQTLIANANSILLPIPYGSGTNLKTAEAISSGRPVIGTTHAFRGFETFENSENVYVTDNSLEFKEYVIGQMWEKKPTVKRRGIGRLSWEVSLEPLKLLLVGLLNA